MIKIIIKITITLLLLVSTLVNAQEFQGKAVYQTKRNFEFSMEKDSTETDKPSMVNDDMKKAIHEMIQKQSEKTYILTFAKTTSIYKEEAQLKKPQPNTGGFSITINTGESGTFYKNTKEETFTKSTESFGKKFLIKDKLTTLKWEMEKETKMIGKYLCMKANAIKMIDDYDTENNKKEKQKELKITAWYAPEIPVNNGPAEYFGLPGLILELHEDNMHYVCTKIVLNPKEKIEIVAPKKGKEINQKDFNEMMDKKSKEMMEQFKGGRKKGNNSNVIMIQG